MPHTASGAVCGCGGGMHTAPGAVCMACPAMGHVNTVSETDGTLHLFHRAAHWPSKVQYASNITGNPEYQTYRNRISDKPDFRTNERLDFLISQDSSHGAASSGTGLACPHEGHTHSATAVPSAVEAALAC